MSSVFRTFCILFVFMILAQGCQTTETVPEHFKQDKITPDYLQNILYKRQAQVQDLKSMVKTTVKTRTQEQTLKQVLLIKGGNSLRMDTLSVFNQPLGIFILNHQDTVFYDIEKNLAYHGLEVWDMMHRALGTILDMEEYLHVFTGNIPHLNTIRWTKTRLNEEKTRYVLEGEDPGRKENIKIELDAVTLLPQVMHKWAFRRPLYAVLWEDYREVDDRMFPHAITVSRPVQNDRVTVEFSSPQINRGITDDTFQIQLQGESPVKEKPSSAKDTPVPAS